MTTSLPAAKVDHPAARWRDTSLPVADRVEALLGQLTLEEKVGQLGSRWVGNDMSADEGADEPDAAGDAPPSTEGDDAAATLNVAPMQDVFAASGTVPLQEAAQYGLGHLTRVYGSVPVTPEEGAAEHINDLSQRYEGKDFHTPVDRVIVKVKPDRVLDLMS